MQFARTALIGVASLALGMVAEARPASGVTDLVLPVPHARPSAVDGKALRPLPEVEGCGSTPIACNTDNSGRLIGGDCLSSNGTYFDEYVFSGNSQEFVTATVRPLSATYTNAWISLVPPPIDSRLAPLLSGGPAATIRYTLPQTGTWRLQLGTNDRFASGDYLLEMSCDDSAPPSPQLGCVEQQILCGQQATWELSDLSCVSSSDSTRFVALFGVYGRGGDSLNMKLTSSAFDPQFAIYEFAQSALPLAQSSATNATTDTLLFTVPHDGFYDIAVTSGNAHGTGKYTLSLDCVSSGCLIPIITKQPVDVVVPRLANAQLTVEATALGDVDYEWFDAEGAQANVGSGPKFTTAPVTAAHSYYVKAITPCGMTTSRVVHVSPAAVDPPPPPPPPPAPPRHRAARH